MDQRLAMFRWVQPDFYSESALTAVNEIHTPVLALLGADDDILRPSQEHTITAALPRATFRLIPEGTHDLQNTTADIFAAEVEAFIR